MSLSKGGSRMLQAAAADLTNPLGPDAPPSNFAWEFYSGTKYRYTWTNGDASAYTEFTDDGVNKARTLGPGVSHWDSGSTVLNTDSGVRHKKGSIYNPTSGWIGVF